MGCSSLRIDRIIANVRVGHFRTLFLSLVAVLRFFVPWQRVWGLIESMTNNQPEPVKEKEF